MEKIAVLGTGAMGSRMAQRLLAAGWSVTVWNRTAERAAAIAGAQVAATPREAADQADIVFAMVRDDEASRQIWLDPESGALGGLHPDALAVECSTVSVPWAHTLASAFAEADRQLVDGPVAGSRPQAEAGQLIFLLGGPEAACERLGPVLAPMAGAVHRVGTTGAGATVKLMINAMLAVQLGLLGELIGYAERAGVHARRAVEIIGETPVCSAAAKAAAAAMVDGAWAPAFPIDLVAKDLALLGRSADEVAAQVPLAQRAAEVFTQGVREGYGGDNITGVVQLYAGSRSTR